MAFIPGSRRSPAPFFPGLARGAVISLTLVLACAPSLPRPPTGRVPRSEMIEVPYPPPPARVETIPPKPNELDVWIDGQWEWTGRVWKWTDGHWTTPPPNAYFTRWTTERRPDGRLYFARATWRGKDGRPISAEEEPCPAPSAPLLNTEPGNKPPAPKTGEVANR